MAGDDLQNRHVAWISAWGIVVVALVAVGGIIAGNASKPFSHDVQFLLAVFVVLVMLALYLTFSPLLGTWPFSAEKGQESREVTVRTSKSSITVLPGATVDVSMLEKYPDDGRLTTQTGHSLPGQNSIPDFTNEWKERDRLMTRCAGLVEEPEAVWAWIQGVYSKLLRWNPRKALEFRPDPPSTTKSPNNLGVIPPAVSKLMSEFEVNHSRKNLTLYGERLAKILDEDQLRGPVH